MIIIRTKDNGLPVRYSRLVNGADTIRADLSAQTAQVTTFTHPLNHPLTHSPFVQHYSDKTSCCFELDDVLFSSELGNILFSTSWLL